MVPPKCQNQLRLIAITKTEAVINKMLVAMHLPAEAPELHPAPPPPGSHGRMDGEAWTRDDRLN